MSSLIYKAGDLSLWQGRNTEQLEYFYQIVKPLDLNDFQILSKNSLQGYALLGFECDEGVRRNLGRQGARLGPKAFRKAASGIAIHSQFNFYDAGDVRCIDENLEVAQQELSKRVEQILSLGLKPIVIGGGHETAWGHYSGIYNYYKESVAILNFDAHFDVRELVDGKLGSSGTPFLQCNQLLQQHAKEFNYYCVGIQRFSNPKSLFDYAKDNNIKYIYAQDIKDTNKASKFIDDILQKHQKIYLSICLDVFRADIAPGVSAPSVFGIELEYVVDCIRKLKQSNKIISLDIVELAPNFDINNQTAKLAGLLMMEYISA